MSPFFGHSDERNKKAPGRRGRSLQRANMGGVPPTFLIIDHPSLRLNPLFGFNRGFPRSCSDFTVSKGQSLVLTTTFDAKFHGWSETPEAVSLAIRFLVSKGALR
jgi:hypothetical protein